jgi:hypothetical protein
MKFVQNGESFLFQQRTVECCRIDLRGVQLRMTGGLLDIVEDLGVHRRAMPPEECIS